MATAHGPTLLGSGLNLPFVGASFNVIYVQHVLHHIGDLDRVLTEIRRCLRPGGVLFLIETAEDNPLIRWERRLNPHWMGDEINEPFRFAGLWTQLERAGFRVDRAHNYL